MDSQVTEALRAQSKCHHTIAKIHFALEEYALAAHHYEQRVQIARRLNDAWGINRGLGNVANAYCRLDPSKATMCYYQCAAKAVVLNDVQTQYKALAGLQALYRRTQELDKVQALQDLLMQLTVEMTSVSSAQHSHDYLDLQRQYARMKELRDAYRKASQSKHAYVVEQIMDLLDANDAHLNIIVEDKSKKPSEIGDSLWLLAPSDKTTENSTRVGEHVAHLEPPPPTQEELVQKLAQLEAERDKILMAHHAYEDEAKVLQAKIESRTKRRPWFVTPAVALRTGISHIFVQAQRSAPRVMDRAIGLGRKTPVALPYRGENPHLVLEHVHAASASDSNRGLLSPRQAKGEKVIYAASGVAVVHDMNCNTQQIFEANDGARVMALALHPNDETVASCHVSAHAASLYFWDWSQLPAPPSLCSPDTVLDASAEKASPLDLSALCDFHNIPPIKDVRAMEFSKFGDCLMLLLEHSAEGVFGVSVLSVEWRKPLKYAFVEHRVLKNWTQAAGMACNTEGDGSLVIAGVGRLSAIRVRPGGRDTGGLEEEVAFKGCCRQDVLLCVAFLGERIVAAGSAVGALWLCDSSEGRTQVLFKLRIHEAALWDISVDSVRLVTVSADSYVKEWLLDEDDVMAAGAGIAGVEEDEGLEDVRGLQLQSVDMAYHVFYGLAALQAQEVAFGPLPLRQWKQSEPGAEWGGVVELRGVCLLPSRENHDVKAQEQGQADSGGIVVATRANEVFLISGSKPASVTLVQTAHTVGGGLERGGVTGLSCHPLLPVFATAGNDGSVRVWNADSRRMVMARVAFSDGVLEHEHAERQEGYHGRKHNSDAGTQGRKAKGKGKKGKGNKIQDTEELLQPLKSYGRHTPTTLSYSDDGSRLAVGFASGSIIILDGDTLEEISPLTILDADEGDQATPVEQIVYLPDGDAVAVQRGTYWTMHSDTNLLSYSHMSVDVSINNDCAIDKTHGMACIAGMQMCGDIGLRLAWGEGEELEMMEKGELFCGHAQTIASVGWLAGGQRLVSIGGDDLSVFQWCVRGDVAQAKHRAESRWKLQLASAQALQHTELQGKRGAVESDTYDPFGILGKDINALDSAPAKLDSPGKMTSAAKAYINARDNREQELAKRHAWPDFKSRPDSFGLEWTNVGVDRPLLGEELVHARLEKVLKRRGYDGRLQLTTDEWSDLGVRQLRSDHYVHAGGFFFMPVVPKIGREKSSSSASGRQSQGKMGTKVDGERFAVCKSTLCSDPRWRNKVGHHQAPENQLELEWVNGYHGHDAHVWLTDPNNGHISSEAGRGNLAFIADLNGIVDGRYIVFFVSAVGVVMDLQQRRQFFFTQHDAEISAMAVHPLRTVVATGQVASHGSLLPPVHIWRPAVVISNNFEQVAARRIPKENELAQTLVGFCEQRITVVGFSASGEYVMAIGQDSVHRFACYDWQAGTILFSGMAGNSDLLMMTSLPSGFAVCGTKEIKVWEHPGMGSAATTNKDGSRWMCGLAPPNVGPAKVECIVSITDEGSACQASIVCGWPDGKLVLFAQFSDHEKTEWVLEYESSRWWQAHDHNITCLCFAKPDTFCNSRGCHEGILISGDERGTIKLWKIETNKGKGGTKPKLPEKWLELADLSFSVLRYHDSIHPRGQPTCPMTESELAADVDAMIDLSPNPLNPPVPLRLCARRIDYLPGEAGMLLIGTSVNSVVMISLSEQQLPDYDAEVVLEGHTGHLRALATLPTSSLSFSVSLQILSGSSHSVVAIKEDEGRHIKDVALKMMPQLRSADNALLLIEQGRLVVSRFDKDEKRWFRFDPFGRGGGQFVPQTSEETLFLWDPPDKAVDDGEESLGIADLKVSLSKISDEGKMTQGRAKVTVIQNLATMVQSGLKPNRNFAKYAGNYMVDVRSVQYDTEPLSQPKGSSKKQRLRMQMQISTAERARQKATRGDVFTLIGDFDVAMQGKLRRAVSRLTGVMQSAISVQRLIFRQKMPQPDPKSTFIQSVPQTVYEVMLRLNVPIHREQKISDHIYKALGARKVSPWVLVRSLVRRGNFAMEASGRRMTKRKRSDDEMNGFEAALKQQGLDCIVRSIGAGRWQHERDPRTVYLTCGDDSILRCWDALERRCVVTKDLGSSRVPGSLIRKRRRALCMAVSPIGPDGDQWLAIGYKEGFVSVHHMHALHANPLVEFRDREQDITVVKFAPTSNLLAVASEERTIDLYAKWFQKLQPGYEGDPSAANFVLQRVGVCRGHSSAVTHLDFSDDAVYLRSNDASGEVMHWSVLDPQAAGHTVHSVNPDKDGKSKVLSRDLAAGHVLESVHKVASTVDLTTGLKNARLKEQGSLVCGQLIKAPQTLRDADWATETCPLAWSLRAIWRPRDVVANIASVARSTAADVVACGYKPVKLKLGTVQDAQVAKEEAAVKYNLMAARLLGSAAVLNNFREKSGAPHRLGEHVGEEHGLRKLSIDKYAAEVLDVHTVKLFRFPAVGVPSSAFMRDGFLTGSAGMPGRGPATRPAWYEAFPKAFNGHASRVTAACFSSDDLWLFTTGGSDCAVFQWRHKRPLYLRWWLARSTFAQEALGERFARVIPRILSESMAQNGNVPVGNTTIEQPWTSEAHYIAVCWQRAMCVAVGFRYSTRCSAWTEIKSSMNTSMLCIVFISAQCELHALTLLTLQYLR